MLNNSEKYKKVTKIENKMWTMAQYANAEYKKILKYKNSDICLTGINLKFS